MENKSDIRAAIDNARLMTRLSIIGGIAALVLLVLTLIFGVIRPEFTGSNVFSLAVIPYVLAALFSLAAMIYGMLGTSASLENEEKLLLEKRRDSRALNVEEDVRFTAGRSFENFRRYTPYVLAILGAVVVGVLLSVFHNYWNGGRLTGKILPDNALHATVISFVMMLLSVFSGAFFVGQSRSKSFRWLRPVGAWLLAGFGVMFCAMIASLFTHNGMIRIDDLIARVIFWIFAVLGAEFVASFVIEFYRPRTLKEQRPIFESRLLALFTEPGGVMRNIASALDYQFGFKVSGTWLYSFLERSFFPLVLVWAVILWGFTMIHEVGPSEVGVRETFGRVTEEKLLEPGIYWTLPWPMGTVKRFSCTEIQQVVVGELHDEKGDDGQPSKKAADSVVLWTNPHGGDDNNFIVAVAPEHTEQQPEADEKQVDGNKSVDVSISFIRMVIPIQYRIRPDGVFDYAYRNANPVETLTRIGQQAATEYLASSSMQEVMSTGRVEAQEAMRKRVQLLADHHDLGIEVMSVVILDAHPPVEKVAPAYQNVIGAMEERETTVLKAQEYSVKTVPAAEAQAAEILSRAGAYKFTTTTVAAAENGRFQSQLSAYNVMPSMFRLRLYLDFLENDCSEIRKFVLSSGIRNEIYELNFEKNERLDLIDADITSLTEKEK